MSNRTPAFPRGGWPGQVEPAEWVPGGRSGNRGLKQCALEYLCVYLKSQWLNSFMHSILVLFINWLPGQTKQTMLILKNNQRTWTCTITMLVEELCLSRMTWCWWTPKWRKCRVCKSFSERQQLCDKQTTIFFNHWPQCGHQECLRVIWQVTHNYVITWPVMSSILTLTYFAGSSLSWYHFQHLF